MLSRWCRYEWPLEDTLQCFWGADSLVCGLTVTSSERIPHVLNCKDSGCERAWGFLLDTVTSSEYYVSRRDLDLFYFLPSFTINSPVVKNIWFEHWTTHVTCVGLHGEMRIWASPAPAHRPATYAVKLHFPPPICKHIYAWTDWGRPRIKQLVECEHDVFLKKKEQFKNFSHFCNAKSPSKWVDLNPLYLTTNYQKEV